MPRTLTCLDVAEYFLSKSEVDAGDVITNLKLQKLVYYAQGFSLAINNRPLFNGQIRAWQHGPVCPELYHHYKAYGAMGIPVPENVDFSKFSSEDIELLDEVYDVYGQFSAWKLRNMTHEEDPWKNAMIDDVITHESMKRFFKSRLNG